MTDVSDNAAQAVWRSDGPGILASAWRYKAAIIAATVAMVLVGYLLSRLLPPRFEATSTVVIADSDAFNQGSGDPERRVRQEERRLTSDRVFRLASEELGLPPEAVKDIVGVRTDPVAGVIEVTGSAQSGQRAAAITNAVVSAYQQANRDTAQAHLERTRAVLDEQMEDLSQRIQELDAQGQGDQAPPLIAQEREVLQSQISELSARSVDLAANVALYGSGLEQIERAAAPREPASPRPLRDAALAGIVGFFVASALAYWRAGYVESQKLDAARMLGAPLLAEIPEFEPPTDERMNELVDIEAAEAYQFLVASFEYAVARSDARSVLVTSARPGDGKTLTSLQLARALTIQGRNVCLVDADVRTRGLSKLLRAQERGGLAALADGADLDSVTRRYRVSEHVRFTFVPTGYPGPQPTGLLGTNRYREAISKIISDNELTIIDSGPLLTVADAWAISALVSGIILVLDADLSREDLVKLGNRVRLIPTVVLGIVVNRVPEANIPPYPYGPARRPVWRRLRMLLDRQRTRRAPAH
jgi:Mrp family chromosome partitioning ATPase